MCGYLALALVGLFELEIAVAMFHLVIMMLPIGAHSWGKMNSGGQKYISDEKLVRAKYLSVPLAALISSTLGLVSGVFLKIAGVGDVSQHLSVVFLAVGTGVVIAGLFLPLCCKLGAERARPYLYAVAFLPMLGLFGVLRLGFWEEFAWNGNGVLGGPLQFALSFLLFALAGHGMSFLFSYRGMKGEATKKERQY